MDDQGLLNKDPRFIAIPGYVEQFLSLSASKASQSNYNAIMLEQSLLFFVIKLKAHAKQESLANLLLY